MCQLCKRNYTGMSEYQHKQSRGHQVTACYFLSLINMNIMRGIDDQFSIEHVKAQPILVGSF